LTKIVVAIQCFGVAAVVFGSTLNVVLYALGLLLLLPGSEQTQSERKIWRIAER
jgi:hypothetical protein